MLSVCDTAAEVGELGVPVGCAGIDVAVSVLMVYVLCWGEINRAIESENKLIDLVAQFRAQVKEAERLDSI